MKKILLILAFVALPLTVMAQPPAATARAEMKKLGFLVGQWQGEGWFEMGPNQRRTFKQTEAVQSKLDGLILTVDGLGKGKLPGSQQEGVIHNAFAVAFYDESAKRFRWQAFRADGLFIDAETSIGENRMVWSFPSPRGGKVRFTIKLTPKGQWHEIGEFSTDGSAWAQFFEMTLERVK